MHVIVEFVYVLTLIYDVMQFLSNQFLLVRYVIKSTY